VLAWADCQHSASRCGEYSGSQRFANYLAYTTAARWPDAGHGCDCARTRSRAARLNARFARGTGGSRLSRGDHAVSSLRRGALAGRTASRQANVPDYQLHDWGLQHDASCRCPTPHWYATRTGAGRRPYSRSRSTAFFGGRRSANTLTVPTAAGGCRDCPRAGDVRRQIPVTSALPRALNPAFVFGWQCARYVGASGGEPSLADRSVTAPRRCGTRVAPSYARGTTPVTSFPPWFVAGRYDCPTASRPSGPRRRSWFKPIPDQSLPCHFQAEKPRLQDGRAILQTNFFHPIPQTGRRVILDLLAPADFRSRPPAGAVLVTYNPVAPRDQPTWSYCYKGRDSAGQSVLDAPYLHSRTRDFLSLFDHRNPFATAPFRVRRPFARPLANPTAFRSTGRAASSTSGDRSTRSC
jgi:hypothetical protein